MEHRQEHPSSDKATLTNNGNGRGNAPSDLGFGPSVASNSRKRLLNRDGSFNVHRRGHLVFRSRSLYHFFLNVSWPTFLSIIACFYLVINLTFAVAYLACSPSSFEGTLGISAGERFVELFFFSVQTFCTIGYGRINPVGLEANILVTIEVFIGLLGFAVATGLCFARFSRPTALIRFSKHAAIAPYQGGRAFEFRIVNERRNQILNLRAKVLMSHLTDAGKRMFHELPLERDHVTFFPLHWTIVHPINESSPLYGLSDDDFRAIDVEFLVLLDGVDDTFSQTVYARSSYKFNEIIWDRRFINILSPLADGTIEINMNRIDELETN